MTTLAVRAGSLVGSVIDSSTSLLQNHGGDIVRFAMGSPAHEAVPVAVFADLNSRIRHAAAFDYAATEGDPALIEALLEFLAPTEEATSADRLLITSGAMQGLDLAGKLFLDPGDLAVVESPTYTNGTATMLSYGARLLEAPVDADGMVVEALPELLAGRTPKVIYVIPTFQNPSGNTLSLARRRMLLDLADRWNAVVIDDDPYGLLRFAGADVPSLRALSGGSPLVVSVRTFSKTIAPGLRIGYVDADPEFIRTMIAAKQGMDTCANLPAQLLIAGFLSEGHMWPHLDRLRAEYRRRKEAMQAALDEHLSGFASWTDPDGGLFLWVTFPPSVDTSDLFSRALDAGVAFIPGRAFSPSGAFGNALRLCFASTGPARTLEGVRRLAGALSR